VKYECMICHEIVDYPADHLVKKHGYGCATSGDVLANFKKVEK